MASHRESSPTRFPAAIPAGSRARGAAALLLLLAAATPAPEAAVLKLRAGSRDPRAAAALRPVGQATPGDLYYAQHDGPIDADWRQALERAGARILGYVPDHAYLVRLAPAQLRVVEALAGTRAVAPVEPDDRIDPGLRAALARPPATGAVGLRVLGLVGEPAEPLARRAQESAAGVVLRDLRLSAGGRAVIQLDLPAASLAPAVGALSRDRSVEYLELVRPIRPLSLDASALVQSGARGAWPFFAAGLTGVGQRVALADFGVDRDACQMVFTAGPGTAANATQPPQCLVTNAADKVASYALLAGADAYDHAADLFHGTRVAGAIAGDRFATPAPRTPPYLLAGPPEADDGLAPGAQLVVQDIGSFLGTLVEGVAQERLMEQAYCAGARVHNSSYGEVPLVIDGQPITAYGVESASADEALWRLRDLSAVFAAGNWGAFDPATCPPGPCAPWNGARSLAGIGAVAKNTITVGASGNPGAGENDQALMAESSRGPTIEGLTKPDLVVPGHNLAALGDETDGNATCQSERPAAFGTSLAAGAVSGAAAIVRQYFTDGYASPLASPGGVRTRSDIGADPPVFNPSNALVKAVLVSSARSLSGGNTGDTSDLPCGPGVPGCAAPSFGQGWGRPALADTLRLGAGPRSLVILADLWNGAPAFENLGRTGDGLPRAALGDREVHSYALQVGPPGPCGTVQSLRCTLAWSDPPASPTAAAALVNDLDLELHGPGGDCVVDPAQDPYFHGNQFHADRAFTDPAAGGWDGLNPIENAWLEQTPTGIYNLRVIGRSIPGNGMLGVPAEPNTATPGPTRIDSTLQGYALICTGEGLTPLAPPSLDVSALQQPAVGCVEDLPTFDFRETLCAGANPPCVAWDWDFGDGTLRSGATANESHQYASAGLFLVRVTGRRADGVEGMAQIPVEVVVGNRAVPGQVGNTLKLSKIPNPPARAVKAVWSDIAVPLATSYNLHEFDDKRQVGSFPPTSAALNTPPVPLHGRDGFRWCADVTACGPSLNLLQVRAANCDGVSGP